jgi:hypothetical protein
LRRNAGRTAFEAQAEETRILHMDWPCGREKHGFKDLPLRFRVDDDLAVFAHADALGADAGEVFEGEMDDATFARGHRIEFERLTGSLDAFGGDAGGHAEFFEAQGAIAAAIEMDFFVMRGFEAQRAQRQMLDGFQDFGVTFKQDFFIATIEVGDNLSLAVRGVGRVDGTHVDFQVQAGGADRVG